MKKTLSFILAIILVAALLPAAVFATDTVQNAEAGITLLYDLSTDLKAHGLVWESAGNKDSIFPISYENTCGLYSFFKAGSGVDAENGAIDNNFVKYARFGNGDTATHTVAVKNSNYISFKINVPVKGKYSINVNKVLSTNDSYDGNMNVYISKAEVKMDEDTFAGAYTARTSVSTENNTASFVKLDEKELDAGEYIVAFKNTDTEYSYGIASSFSLVSGGGSEKVLTRINSSVDRTALNLESFKNAQISVDAIYLSDRTKADESYEVTYSYASNNDAVATVDNTGKITATGTGTADITVCATDSYGAVAKSVHTVTVSEYGYKILYNLSSDLYRLNATYSYRDKTPITTLNPENTYRFYEYFKAKSGVNEESGLTDSNNIKYAYFDIAGQSSNRRHTIQLKNGNTISFKINVPAGGEYNLEVNRILQGKDSWSSNVKVYVSKNEASTNEADLVGTYNGYANGSATEEAFISLGTKNLEKGEYIVTFSATDATSKYGIISSFALVSGTRDALMGGKITSNVSSINVDENETATVSATGYLSSTAQATTVFTYTSSDTAVATVDEVTGVITPVKEGKVTITATATDAEIANTLTTDITITCNKPGEAVEDTTVNFQASAYEGGTVSNDDIQDVAIGSDFTVTATPDTDYTFAYWKNSAGVVLSTNATETFKVSTNMGVIAVFDKIPTDAAIPVYFYNGNGLLLGSASVAKNTTFGVAKKDIETPTLIGYAFSHWSNKNAETPISDTDAITALTRAVAQYKDDETKTYTVKNGETIVASSVKYGESVTVNGSENFSCWKLGDEIVSYKKDYTFDVYGNITLTEVTGEAVAKAPVLVLDKVDGNYFLTYDAGDYKLVEAGILFGDGNVNIGSTNGYKAAAKKGTGQFTALPHKGATEETKARGYMIFLDEEEKVRVIYAD